MSLLRTTALGVDVQADRVLLALVEVRGREAAVKRLASVAPPESTTDDPYRVLAAVIARAIRDEALASDTMVVGLPAGSTIVRRLKVPVTGRRKVQSALAYAVEPLIPFAAEDIYADCLPIRETEEGTDVLALAVKREEVAQLARALEQAGAAPDILAPELLPVLDAIPSAGFGRGDREVLVYLSDGRGFFAVREGECIVDFRTLRGTPEDAALQRDAHRSLRALVGGESRVAQVSLFADAARLDVQAGAPDVPCVIGHLQWPATVPDSIAAAVGDPTPWTAAVCLAAQGLGRVRYAVNLRRGDLQPDLRSTWLAPARRVGAIAVSALVVYAVSLGVQRAALQAHETALRRQVEHQFLQGIPDAKTVANAPRRVQELRELHEDVAVFIQPGPSPLDVLAACDAAIRSVPKVRIESLNLSGSILRLTGEVADFQAVSGLENRLAESPMFTEVQTTRAGEGRRGAGTSFRLSARVSATGSLIGMTLPAPVPPAGATSPVPAPPSGAIPAGVAPETPPPAAQPPVVVTPVRGEQPVLAPVGRNGLRGGEGDDEALWDDEDEDFVDDEMDDMLLDDEEEEGDAPDDMLFDDEEGEDDLDDEVDFEDDVDETDDSEADAGVAQ